MGITKNRNISNKPIVHGPVNGNAFSIMGAVRAAMQIAGVGQEKIEEMLERGFSAKSYNELLVICMEYADFNI